MARDVAERATFATSQRVAAVVRPASLEEVRTALRICSEEKVRVHPVSRGKNYGFGSRVPPRDGCVLLDLSRMDRVVEHDEALGFITVEPGVSFAQAHAYLQARGSRLRLTTIGGPPEASLVGNALERGEGRGPYSDSFGALVDLEVVLSTGEVVRTGLSRFGSAARARGLHRWGLGPALDGLFSQSALGVVTKATLWLAPASDFVRDLVARVEVEALPPVVDAFRELLLEGTLRSNVVLWNDVKAMALARQYPFEEAGGRTPLPPELLAAWREAAGVGRWSGASTVFAPDRGIGLLSTRRARRALVRAGAEEVRSFGPEDGAEPQGVPTRRPLAMAYWRKRSPVPAEPDLDRDGCGAIWVDVAVPFQGAAAAQAARIGADVMPLLGFEPNLSLLSAGARCLFLAALIAYDRDVPGEDDRAMACHRALVRELGAAGFPPLRSGVESVGLALPSADDSEEVLQRVKAALDPSGVLVGGKHGRW